MFSAFRIPLQIQHLYEPLQKANLKDEEILTRIYSKIEKTLKDLEHFIIKRHKHSCVQLHPQLYNRCLGFTVKSSAELELLSVLLSPFDEQPNEFSFLATCFYKDINLCANAKILLSAEMSDDVYRQTKHMLENVEDKKRQQR